MVTKKQVRISMGKCEKKMQTPLTELVRDIHATNDFIPLHAPTFAGNEQAYLAETINRTFVSNVGKFIDEFEQKVQDFTNTSRAIATVNGTTALHTALHLIGVKADDLVTTQALTFVAICNVLHHMGARPVFVDIEPVAFGVCPKAIYEWLSEYAFLDADGQCRHSDSGATIKAIKTRPVWQLMYRLPMFANSLRGSLINSEWAEARLVSLPSSAVGV